MPSDRNFPFLTKLAKKYGKSSHHRKEKKADSASLGRQKFPNLWFRETKEYCFCADRRQYCDCPPQKAVFLASDKLDEALGWCPDKVARLALLKMVFTVPDVAVEALHSLWENVFSRTYLPVLKESSGGLGLFRPYAIQCKMFLTNLVAWARVIDAIDLGF